MNTKMLRYAAIELLWAGSFYSCKFCDGDNEPLSDELIEPISKNLSENGSSVNQFINF